MQAVFMYLAMTHIYIQFAHMHVTIINEKEAINVKEGMKGYMEEFGVRKGKENDVIML